MISCLRPIFTSISTFLTFSSLVLEPESMNLQRIAPDENLKLQAYITLLLCLSFGHKISRVLFSLYHHNSSNHSILDSNHLHCLKFLSTNSTISAREVFFIVYFVDMTQVQCIHSRGILNFPSGYRVHANMVAIELSRRALERNWQITQSLLLQAVIVPDLGGSDHIIWFKRYEC